MAKSHTFQSHTENIMSDQILDAEVRSDVAVKQQQHHALVETNNVQTDSQSMMRLIEAAMAKPDFDVDKLERLMLVKDRLQAQEAKNAFVVAMAEFKRNPPEIFKDKQVTFTTTKGTTSYKHATIGNVVEKIVAGLADHGFSHRWIPNRLPAGMISVTCVITHKLGHSEETTLEAGMDDSGGKNNIQAMISTKTYLERHSLLGATGLATMDQEDDDGRSGGSAGKSETSAPTVALPAITGKNFDKAIMRMRRKEFDGTAMRGWYALTKDQETVLSDVEKEMGRNA